MGRPFSLPVIASIAAGATATNILQGIPQRIPNENSRIDVALTREVVELLYGIEIGSDIAIARGSPSQINTTNGSLPRFDQDGVGSFGVSAGTEIAIFVSNTNAAAKEFRAQIRITAISDLGLLPTNLA